MQADRFLDKRKADPKLPVDDKWDDAVKSLLNYPDVVKMMSADLDWTSALGEAVVADQGAVLEAIQSFRRRAQAAGNLKSDGKQVVAAEKEIITIVPADPQVIYVPQYNPATVVVAGGSVGLLPDALPVVLLPVCAGRRARRRRDLGRGDRRGVERRPLRHELRRQRQHQHQSQHQYQHRQYQPGGVNAATRPAGGSTAWKSNKQPGQVSSSVGKTAPSARVGDARAGGRGVGGGGARASTQPARRNGRSASARGAASASASPRDSYGGSASRGGRRRRRLRRLWLRAANPDGQFARRLEPQFDVQRRGRVASMPGGGGAWRWRRWRAAVAVVADGRSIAMHPFPSIESKASPMNITHLWSCLRRLALALLLAVPLVAAAAAPQETFATPEAAVDALMAALKADSDSAMVAIFGEEHKDLVFSSDRAAVQRNPGEDSRRDADAARAASEPSPDRRVLVIGDEAWPVPIPIVRAGDRWRFATEEGEDEIVNRRIGGNERNAIYVLRAYVDAQRAYATRDRDGDGVLQYAQKLASAPGKHDGLYWPADAAKGEEASPFGPLIAESAAYLKGHAAGDPYRGYHFRILTRQGKDAPGGAYNYVINGRMIAGFAMVAYPAEWGRAA